MPEHWSQVAADILAQKYFRKAGVPAAAKRVEENTVPSWLWRSVPDQRVLESLPETARFIGETDARQVFDRLAGTWTYWGWKAGYFTTEEDASAFFDELRYMLAMQMGAPNSPQWFNTGLHWAYGIDGPSQGHYYVDFATGEIKASSPPTSTRSRMPASSSRSTTTSSTRAGSWTSGCARRACSNTARAPASNFSKLRGENEPLSGGGKSSGLMSFLKIGDRAAGAIKSGGTTRRAAKMVVVDIDHPDIENYINWKVIEEQKVAALVTGSKILSERLNAILKACVNCEADGDGCFDPKCNPALKREVKAARKAKVPDNCHPPGDPVRPPGLYLDPFPDLRHRLGFGGLSHRLGPELQQFGARHRRFPARASRPTTTGTSPTARTARSPKTVKARDAVGAGRPCRLGLRRSRHPVPHHHQRLAHLPGVGAIKASNPCSEYMFLDDTACNLASLNLMAFRKQDGSFDVEAYEHAIRLWTIVLEIAVTMAQFPSRQHCPALLRIPDARPRLRQYRRPADGLGHSLRLARGPRAVRGAHRDHDRRRLRHQRGDGARAWRLPRL